MKAALITLTMFISLPSFAWNKVVSCDNGQFVIDSRPSSVGGFDYQMVFRGNVAKWAKAKTQLEDFVVYLGHGACTTMTLGGSFKTSAGDFDISLRGEDSLHRGNHLVIQTPQSLGYDDIVSDYNFHDCKYY